MRPHRRHISIWLLAAGYLHLCEPLIDALALDDLAGAVDDHAGRTAQDRFDFDQAVIAQGAAGVDHVHEQIGESNGWAEFDRAAQRDEFGAEPAPREVVARQPWTLR